MTVKDIKSDTIVVMTPELYQEFCIGGCVPMCHLTFKNIKIGDNFKLSSVQKAVKEGSNNYNKLETIDVMLSEFADVEEFKNIQHDKIYQEKKRRKEGGGCFRVNGKIQIQIWSTQVQIVEVTLRENDTALTVNVNDDFTADGKNFGYIEVNDGSIHTKEVFWDNLSYFFKICKKKKRCIKHDLKVAEQFYPGVVSDIKKLIKKAFEVEILSKESKF